MCSRDWKMPPNCSLPSLDPATEATRFNLVAKTSLRNNKPGSNPGYWPWDSRSYSLDKVTEHRKTPCHCGVHQHLWDTPIPPTCRQPSSCKPALRADPIHSLTGNSVFLVCFLSNRILIYKKADNISMEINFTLSLHWQVELQVSAM